MQGEKRSDRIATKRLRKGLRGAIAFLTLLGAGWPGLGAQEGAPLPFAVGEELRYQLSAGRLGRVGRGTMSVDGHEDVRGHRALLLRFDVRGRVGPLKVETRTSSWVTPTPFASLRFTKSERQFLHGHDVRVEIYPSHKRWLSELEAGDGGVTPTDAPLDELSFIYFLRTLPLEDGAHYSLSRHFQAERNPVEVAVLGRETIMTPAGQFATVLVEMRVKDPRHYQKEGVLRLNLTDDAARIPVRIETSMPVVGTTVLTLEARRDGGAEVAHR